MKPTAWMFLALVAAAFAAPPQSLGPAAEWKGGASDKDLRRIWSESVLWRHAESASLSRSFDRPQDWSRFGAVSFWLHSEKATGSGFMLIFASENPNREGSDYYSWKITLDWSGWRQFVLPLNELGAAREPLGWNHINSVTFTASGWGNTPDPTAVARLDGFELVPGSVTGQRMTDAELFANLDLDMPQLAAVRRAVRSGDLAGAKAALAAHVRNRRTPRWLLDWRDHPFLGVKAPAPEADRAPESWDYFSTYITIDWQGWKHFHFKKTDFTPNKFVEGRGWEGGKQPIGWHWIRYITLSAAGWDLKPDPQTVLHFDDIKLVGQNQTVVIGDFEKDDAAWEGLSRSRAPAKSGRFAGTWQNQAITTRIKCAKIPHDWTGFDTLDFWVHSEKATGSRLILVLDSDVERESAKLQKILQHRFDYTQGPGRTATLEFGPKIDWTANPTAGEARTHLWNESLNRHFHFRALADAYWNTGMDKYAQEIADQLLDWTASNPAPVLSSGNQAPRGSYAWQTLTTGIRLADVWPYALYRCLGSPAFRDEVLWVMLKSVCEQARHLARWPTGGNWLTAESNGLFTAGMLFPEFKEARAWRRIAIQRLYRQLDEEVYPDGMEYELAAGYNNWVVSEFAHIVEMADLNGLRRELPADFLRKMEKMFNYLLYASMPNGQIPGLNDSGNSDVRGLLATGHRLFPKRQDFLFLAADGRRGRQPQDTSHAFPYSGHYVMRSGWDKEATYLLFDAGPFGFSHQHEDKLHFVLWSHGRQHLPDAGNFSYDRSRWRRYVLATAGHNTVMVDGEGQHRAGKKETYFWPRPWKAPAPPGNDARWISTPEYDYAAGVYTDGYGPKNEIAVTHQRRILFAKPENIFIVMDTLIPADGAGHRYEAIFHLDTTNAVSHPQTKAVRTDNADASNLTITPLVEGNLSVGIVKGREDEPVQGWANGPWRAIPTAIYQKTGTGIVKLFFVLSPEAKAVPPAVTRVEKIATDFPGLAARIVWADGRSLTVLQSDRPGESVRGGGVETTAEVALLRTDAGGQRGKIIHIGWP